MEKNRRFRSLKDRIMRKKMFARVVKVLIGIILVFPAQAQEKQQRVSLAVEQQTVSRYPFDLSGYTMSIQPQ